jgi:voltage-gated potassium channel
MKKIAVFGDTDMALETMSRLDAEVCDALYFSRHPDEVEKVRSRNFQAEISDFSNDEDLTDLGIGTKIDYLFCLFANDSDNVFLTLSARTLAEDLIIIAVVDDPEAAGKLLAAGADKIIDPYEICARKTHEMLIKPEITDILDHTLFHRHDLNVAEIEISPGSPLQHQKLGSLNLNENHDVILIGVVDKERGKTLHFAAGEQDYQLNAGDILIVMGPAGAIGKFRTQVLI